MQPNQNPQNQQPVNQGGVAPGVTGPQYAQGSGQPSPSLQNYTPSNLFTQTQYHQPNFTGNPQIQAPAPIAASQMKHSWSLKTIFLIVFLVLMLLGATGFAIWAFAERQDYKDNSDKKSAEASAIAVENESKKKDAEFLEKEKQPYEIYSGPDAYGSIKVTYPKTWSVYAVEAGQGATPLDAYFHPKVVPDTKGGTAFALRVQVLNSSYEQEMKKLDSAVKGGKVKVVPYALPKIPNVKGSKVTGEVNVGQNDTMIVLPLRDKTIKISTESPEFLKDFDSIIMTNMTFSP